MKKRVIKLQTDTTYLAKVDIFNKEINYGFRVRKIWKEFS